MVLSSAAELQRAEAEDLVMFIPNNRDPKRQFEMEEDPIDKAIRLAMEAKERAQNQQNPSRQPQNQSFPPSKPSENLARGAPSLRPLSRQTNFLDQEGLRAMRAAAPFLHPPKGLLDGNRQVVFSFGFSLDLTGASAFDTPY